MLLEIDFYVADTCKNMKPLKIIFRNKGIYLTEKKVNIKSGSGQNRAYFSLLVF